MPKKLTRSSNPHRLVNVCPVMFKMRLFNMTLSLKVRLGQGEREEYREPSPGHSDRGPHSGAVLGQGGGPTPEAEGRGRRQGLLLQASASEESGRRCVPHDGETA